MIVIIFRTDIFCFNFSRTKFESTPARSQQDFLPCPHKLISFWWRLFYRCNCSTHRGHESNSDNMYRTNFIVGYDSNRQNWISRIRGRKRLLRPDVKEWHLVWKNRRKGRKGIYKSLTETWMWKLWLRSRNSFSGHELDFCCSAFVNNNNKCLLFFKVFTLCCRTTQNILPERERGSNILDPLHRSIWFTWRRGASWLQLPEQVHAQSTYIPT